ncbi:MAG: hypothetical protein JWM19_6543 [Actinomycetia bacterium]|nr:hypothetical protein [Actinomycetes bacterium]
MHVRNVLAAISVAVAAVGAGTVTAPAAVAATASSAVSTIYSFHNPDGVAISPDGKTAYVADSGAVGGASGAAEYGLFVVAAATNTITKTIISPGFDAPVAVAVSPSGGYVYVLNSTGTVSVVSTASDTVTATIGTPNTNDPAPESIVISPDGKTGYVSDNGAGVISVLNLATDSVTTTIGVTTPSALALSPDGAQLYVSTSDGISVISTASDTVSRTVALIGSLGGMVVSPDGGTLYVAENGDPYENILIISTTTLSFTGTIYGQEVGLGNYVGSGALVLSPDGTSLYLAASNGTSAQVTTVNTARDVPTATAAASPETSISSLTISAGGVIYAAGVGASSQGTVAVIGTNPFQFSGVVASVGSHPVALALSPDGKTAYVANYDSGNLTVIGTATGIATGVVAVGNEPDAVAVSSDGTTVYVVNDNSSDAGTVSVIDAGTLAVTATIPVGIHPTSIAISPDGKTIYVANQGSVSVIKAAEGSVTTSIPVAGPSLDLAVSPDGSTVYVAEGGDVVVISTVTDKVTTTFDDWAWTLAVSPDGKTLYSAWGADNLSVINAATGAVVKTLNPVYDYGLTGSLALSPGGKTLYVAGSREVGTNVPGSGEVTAIDTASDAIASTLPVPNSSTELSAVAVSPTGTALYVTDPGTSTVDALPAPAAITSRAAATFTTGRAGTFAVMASGTPTPSLRESGTLPGGVTFKANGNGTATLSGTPLAGSGKVYHVTITASNGVGTAVPQSFSLTVDQAPKITSAARVTFTYRKKGSFKVTTSGYPVAALTESGALPKGVTFKNNRNGTATLAGTPAVDANKTYTITIRASNGVGSAATVKFQIILKK